MASLSGERLHSGPSVMRNLRLAVFIDMEINATVSMHSSYLAYIDKIKSFACARLLLLRVVA